MRARRPWPMIGNIPGRRSWTIAVFLMLLIAVWSAAAPAEPLAVGDVLVGIGSSADGSGRGQVRQFAPDGTLRTTLDTTSGSFEETGMCMDATYTLYTTNFEANSMST